MQDQGLTIQRAIIQLVTELGTANRKMLKPLLEQAHEGRSTCLTLKGKRIGEKRGSQILPKNNICKTSFIQHEQKNLINKSSIVQQNISSSTFDITDYEAQQKQKRKTQIIEDDDDEIYQPNQNQTGTGAITQDQLFFLTDQGNQSELKPSRNESQLLYPDQNNNTFRSLGNYVTSKTPIKDNLGSTIKRRTDSKIISWKCNSKTPNKICYIEQEVSKKKFMESVGPGSYNLNKSTQIVPISKSTKEANDFFQNNNRVQDLLILRKEATKIKDALNSTNLDVINGDPNSFRSRSQMSGSQNFQIIGMRSQLLKPIEENYQKHEVSRIDNSIISKTINQSAINVNGDRLSMINKNTLQMANLGPGSYKIKSTFDSSAHSNVKIQKKLMPYNAGRTQSSPLKNQETNQYQDRQRFSYYDKQLDRESCKPGPGFYTKENKQSVMVAGDQILEIFHSYEIPKVTKQNYPSFGTTQKRELKLISNEVQQKPGPGQYQLSFNLDELLSKCDDKQLVKTILQNVQERKPSKVFLSKEPRIAVFGENKLMKEDGLEKYYNQEQNTFSQQQMKLQQRKLEKLVHQLKKDYPNVHGQNQQSTTALTFEYNSEPRFKADKKILETQLLGPGSYYNENSLINNSSQKDLKYVTQVKPSAVFKSGTKRGLLDQINLQENMNTTLPNYHNKSQQEDKTTAIPNDTSQNQIDKGRTQQSDNYQYQSQLSQYSQQQQNISQNIWDKKSFNLKYNKQARENVLGGSLITRNNRSVIDRLQTQSQLSQYE
eukprot:403336865